MARLPLISFKYPASVPVLVKKLPREGFTQITVSDGLKKLLKRVAKAEGKSMPKLILNMTEKQYPEHLADEARKEKEEKAADEQCLFYTYTRRAYRVGTIVNVPKWTGTEWNTEVTAKITRVVEVQPTANADGGISSCFEVRGIIEEEAEDNE